jgi:hypothetical protein
MDAGKHLAKSCLPPFLMTRVLGDTTGHRLVFLIIKGSRCWVHGMLPKSHESILRLHHFPLVLTSKGSRWEGKESRAWHPDSEGRVRVSDPVWGLDKSA